MCEVTSFTADRVTTDVTFILDDPAVTTTDFSFTEASCGYTVAVAVAFPPELSTYTTELTYDAVTQTFGINFLETVATLGLAASTYEVTVTATLDEPLGATTAVYPYDRSILTTSFTWALELLTRCSQTTLINQVLPDVTVYAAPDGTQGPSATQTITVFKDSEADLNGINGVGCGGQTLSIEVYGLPISLYTWIKETTTGTFAA